LTKFAPVLVRWRAFSKSRWLISANLFPSFAWASKPPFPAPEARQKVAHGETVGRNAKTNPAPAGAKEFFASHFLPPLPGLEIFLND
jgi:hypothetical protein